MDIQYLQNQSTKFDELNQRDRETNKSEWPFVFHAINTAVFNIVDIFQNIIQSQKSEITQKQKTELARNIYFAKRLIGDVRGSSFDFADQYDDDPVFEELESNLADVESDFELTYSDTNAGAEELVAMSNELKKHDLNKALISHQNYYFINQGNEESENMVFDDDLSSQIGLVQARLLESFNVFGTMPQVVKLESGAHLAFEDESLKGFRNAVFNLEFPSHGFYMGSSNNGKSEYKFYSRLSENSDEQELDLEAVWNDAQYLELDYELGKILSVYSATNSAFRYAVLQHHLTNRHDSQDGEIFSYFATSYQEAGAN